MAGGTRHGQLAKLAEAMAMLGVDGLALDDDAPPLEGGEAWAVLPETVYLAITHLNADRGPAGFVFGAPLVDRAAREMLMLTADAEAAREEVDATFDEVANVIIGAWNKDADDADVLELEVSARSTRRQSRDEVLAWLLEHELTLAGELTTGDPSEPLIVFGPVGWMTDRALTEEEAITALQARQQAESSDADGDAAASAGADGDSADGDNVEVDSADGDATKAAASKADAPGPSGGKPATKGSSAARSSGTTDASGELKAAMVVVDESGILRKWIFEQVAEGNLLLGRSAEAGISSDGKSAVLLISPHAGAVYAESTHIFEVEKAS